MSNIESIDVSGIDENHLLYGNFIGLQYVFETSLDIDVLSASVDQLIHEFPALAMRYVRKGGCIKPSAHTVYLTHKKQPQTIKACLATNTRPDCVFEPPRKKVLAGQAPLSTFTLTEFKCGGAIFGVAISHLLTDAAGFHKVMQHLSGIYTELATSNDTPKKGRIDFPFVTDLDVFKFGTQRTKRQCQQTLKAQGLPKPIPIKGLMGKLVQSLIVKAMDKSLRENPAIRLHFSAGDITRLKQTVLLESGEAWISTHMALCAHFTLIIAKLSYQEELKTEMQIGQLLDLRNRCFEGDEKEQENFIGNAILIHIDKASFPQGLQNTDRGAMARYFKNRQSTTDSVDVKTRLDLLSDCLRQGYTNPELDVKKPIISLNNQSKMPVYDLHFDGQSPQHIVPQDVGDNVMFFPSADGGVDIHIRDIVNFGNQQALLSPEWQEKIFDF